MFIESWFPFLFIYTENNVRVMLMMFENVLTHSISILWKTFNFINKKFYYCALLFEDILHEEISL